MAAGFPEDSILKQAFSNISTNTQAFSSAFDTGMKVAQAAKQAEMENVIKQQSNAIALQKAQQEAMNWGITAIDNGLKLPVSKQAAYFEQSREAILKMSGIKVGDGWIQLLKLDPDLAEKAKLKMSELATQSGGDPVKLSAATPELVDLAKKVIGSDHPADAISFVNALLSVPKSAKQGRDIGETAELDRIKEINKSGRRFIMGDVEKGVPSIQALQTNPSFGKQILLDENGKPFIGPDGKPETIQQVIGRAAQFKEGQKALDPEQEKRYLTAFARANEATQEEQRFIEQRNRQREVRKKLAETPVPPGAPGEKDIKSFISKLSDESPDAVKANSKLVDEWLNKGITSQDLVQRSRQVQDKAVSLIEQSNKEIKEITDVKSQFNETVANIKKAINSGRVNEVVSVAGQAASTIGGEKGVKTESDVGRQFQKTLIHDLSELKDYVLNTYGSATLTAQQKQQLLDRLKNVGESSKAKINSQLRERLSSFESYRGLDIYGRLSGPKEQIERIVKENSKPVVPSDVTKIYSQMRSAPTYKDYDNEQIKAEIINKMTEKGFNPIMVERILKGVGKKAKK